MLIRPAAADELAAVGDLTVDAYAADGYLDHADDYADELRDAARRAELATLLVAVDELSGGAGQVLGTATFFLAGTPYAEVSRPGEAEFRMLAVAEKARGQGVGAALVQSCIERARAAGCSALALCSLMEMTPAHRIYQRMGFVRAPDRDWDPLPRLTLIAFVLPLQPTL